MSMITECTVVIKKEDATKLEQLAKERKNRESNVVQAFSNKDICVYVFDCNGEPLNIQDNIDCIIVEVNYGGSEEFWTLHNGKDSDKSATELLREMLTEKEFDSLHIEYTI